MAGPARVCRHIRSELLEEGLRAEVVMGILRLILHVEFAVGFLHGRRRTESLVEAATGRGWGLLAVLGGRAHTAR